MTEVFHSGEVAVQTRAGVRGTAAKLGPRMIQTELPADFAQFLAHQSFLYLAAVAPDGHVWATALAGPAGFTRAVSRTRVEIHSELAAEDPVGAILTAGPSPAGVLVLEAMSRSRIRLNGTVRVAEDHLVLDLSEVFGNCPKYIQRRQPSARAAAPAPGTNPARHGDRLDPGQRALVSAADTFIIASRHPERGADASHRGGRPGFIAVSPDGRSLTFPDYPGNTMFQTLGNLSVDPAVGLLFVDWSSGRTLQITGSAQIDWDSDRIARWDQAERLIDVAIDAVVDRPAGLPVLWTLIEAHRLNPAVPSVPERAAAQPSSTPSTPSDSRASVPASA